MLTMYITFLFILVCASIIVTMINLKIQYEIQLNQPSKFLLSLAIFGMRYNPLCCDLDSNVDWKTLQILMKQKERLDEIRQDEKQKVGDASKNLESQRGEKNVPEENVPLAGMGLNEINQHSTPYHYHHSLPINYNRKLRYLSTNTCLSGSTANSSINSLYEMSINEKINDLEWKLIGYSMDKICMLFYMLCMVAFVYWVVCYMNLEEHQIAMHEENIRNQRLDE